MYTVDVDSTWEATNVFEFESLEAAEKFRERVNAGGNESLDAIIEVGDVDSSAAHLSDFKAREPQEVKGI